MDFVRFGLILTAAFAAPAEAETYYVAPIGATIAGGATGTEAAPFNSIAAAFAAGAGAGDTLLLMDGDHGNIVIKDRAFSDFVTITAQHDKAAHATSIAIKGNASHIMLTNLSVWPLDPAQGSGPLVNTSETTSFIVVDGLDVRGGADGDQYRTWDAAQWHAHKFPGARLAGDHSAVQNSTFTGLYTGIVAAGDSDVIFNNLISGFDGDGIQAVGDNDVVRNNTVQNCVATDANHDDGLQSFTWKHNLVVNGLGVEGNLITEWRADEQPSPLRCQLQGIGMFDGFYVDLAIRNNVIVTNQFHGITVNGGRRVEISGNTVVNALGKPGNSPYIMISPHKKVPDLSGPELYSLDVSVHDNRAMAFKNQNKQSPSVVFARSNVVITRPSAELAALPRAGSTLSEP